MKSPESANPPSSEFKNPPEVIIREATPDDTEGIRRMQAKSWRETYPSPENGVSREWVEEKTTGWFEPEGLAKSRGIWGQAISDPAQFFRVAEMEGRIVGMIHGVIQEDVSGHLWGLYTDKSQHGTGLSSRFMDGLIEFFRQNNVRKVDLEVASYNGRAIRFYEKHGFAKVPDSEHHFAEIMPVINM